MKGKRTPLLRQLLLWLMALILLVGPPPEARAEVALTYDPLIHMLTPPAQVYQDGNITLEKWGERTGPDTWTVNVKATVGATAVEKPKMEVVFVLDCSGSMAWCTETFHNKKLNHEEHTYTDSNKASDSCYKRICGISRHASHTDSCYSTTACSIDTYPDHWNDDGEHIGTTCKAVTENDVVSYYPLTCGKAIHKHTESCFDFNQLTCTKTLQYHGTGNNNPCWIMKDGEKYYYTPTRIEVAKASIKSMTSTLQSSGSDVVTTTYVIFSSGKSSTGKVDYDNNVGKPNTQSAMVVTPEQFDDVTAEGNTHMYQGISLGIDQFSDNDYKKVLVIIADGAENDSDAAETKATAALNTFKANGGTVFTVGFTYDGSKTLTSLAGGEGGKYVYAGDDEELFAAMENIETAITAMLEDPMSPTVGFDRTSINEVSTANGVITPSTDTIYWHPDAENPTVNNSTIQYSYEVSLNDAASRTVGTHGTTEDELVPLNNPTYFRYGTQKTVDGVTTTDMQEVLFPIPHAKYELSSLTTKFMCGEDAIADDLTEPAVISDWHTSDYIPTFTQDYKNPPQIIPIANSNNYYRYTGETVVTSLDPDVKDAETVTLSGVNAVDATQSVAYTVVHKYELVEAGNLVVGGTKTLLGRDFESGDTFTFTLTPEDGAPMPKDAEDNTVTSVTISPTTGNSAAFSFGAISFSAAGTYKYTIKETPGSNPELQYDNAEHKLDVTVTEATGTNGKEMAISYTVDDVANGALTFTNSLKPGSLKVTKAEVVSHLAQHQQTEFGFIIDAKNQSGNRLSGSYTLTKSTGTTETVTFPASVRLKAKEFATIGGLPEGTTYTVTEDNTPGFTTTSTGETGTIEANETSTASFTNQYTSAGQYQFVAHKSLTGAPLTAKLFSFSVKDSNGNVVANGTNTYDGNIFLDMLHFKVDDGSAQQDGYIYLNKDEFKDGVATRTFTIAENIPDSPLANWIYDQNEYQVTLTITDNGKGVLTCEGSADIKLLFANEIGHKLIVSKEVAGNMGSRNREFTFTLTAAEMANQSVNLSTDGGKTYTTDTMGADGTTTFTLKHGESLLFYPITGAYTVTETDYGSYIPTYTINGTAGEGASASGTNNAAGSTVAFTNTLDVPPPTGVRTPYTAALAGMFLALGLLAITLLGRRWPRVE